MSSNLVDAARKSRSSGAVLKLELAHLKTRMPQHVVFILEGKEDYGPYECWIDRAGVQYEYSLLCGKGKGQLLDLRRRLTHDKSKLKQGVYFIVDSDFDGLKGQTIGSDIYMTETYSVENSLVGEDVLRSVLLDEFQLAGAPQVVDKIIDQYKATRDQFCEVMRKANFRIFYRANLKLGSRNINNTVKRFVNIEFDCATQCCPDAELIDLIPLTREPCEKELIGLEPAFNKLDPINHYRGKYWLAFFKAWLDIVSKLRKNGHTEIPELASLSFASSQLSMRSLASRRPPPLSLKNFLQAVSCKSIP